MKTLLFFTCILWLPIVSSAVLPSYEESQQQAQLQRNTQELITACKSGETDKAKQLLSQNDFSKNTLQQALLILLKRDSLMMKQLKDIQHLFEEDEKQNHPNTENQG